jgi:hypothetical protein
MASTATVMRLTTIYFEPWGLGDVLVAAAILRENPAAAALACKSRWHPLLRAVLPESVPLLPVELPYTTGERRGPFDCGAITPLTTDRCEVLSIRGDIRDRGAARRLFPAAVIRVSGWCDFPPHYSWLLDIPYADGWLKVRNHYRAWAGLGHVPYERLQSSYRHRQEVAPRNKRVVVHAGSHWRAKQYPHVAALRQVLQQRGYTVQIVAGPNDRLPSALTEGDVARLVDQPLMDAFRVAEFVVTNDSAAMHLAALLGCHTLAIARVVNIAEWLPPATWFIASRKMPRGYRPDPRLTTDQELEDWPRPEEVVDTLLRSSNA